MNTDDILNAIDGEIARLQQARNVLAELTSPKRRGRPPASAPTRRRRTLSPAARKKIADAQRMRWTRQKAAAKKATKKTPARKVTITKLPPKQSRERKSRTQQKASLKNSLSSRSGTVAVPNKNEQAP